MRMLTLTHILNNIQPETLGDKVFKVLKCLLKQNLLNRTIVVLSMILFIFVQLLPVCKFYVEKLKASIILYVIYQLCISNPQVYHQKKSVTCSTLVNII